MSSIFLITTKSSFRAISAISSLSPISTLRTYSSRIITTPKPHHPIPIHHHRTFSTGTNTHTSNLTKDDTTPKQHHDDETTTKTNEQQQQQQHRRLDIVLVGAPNAGKSQLLNTLLNTKLAAVSRKKHTTRSDILGVRTIRDTQLVFVDTPGFLQLKSSSSNNNNKKDAIILRSLSSKARDEIQHADFVLLVVDAARRMNDSLRESLVTLMLKSIYTSRMGKYAIVLNKVDLVSPKTKLLDVAMEVGSMAQECLHHVYQKEENDDETNETKTEKTKKKLSAKEMEERNRKLEDYYPNVFMVSALHDDGVDDILRYLLKLAQPGEWIVDKHETTSMTVRERVEEIIREKIYRAVHREVPHRVSQVNRVFEVLNKKRPNGVEIKGQMMAIRIDQDLVVKTESHRRILKGKSSMTLRGIEKAAKKDLEELFSCTVVLNLHVKLQTSQHLSGGLEADTLVETLD